MPRTKESINNIDENSNNACHSSVSTTYASHATFMVFIPWKNPKTRDTVFAAAQVRDVEPRGGGASGRNPSDSDDTVVTGLGTVVGTEGLQLGLQDDTC